jgi:hypothetical protein
VAAGVAVAARLYPADPASPWILHFHGNGEIAADYDGLAPAFRALGASLLCADFRGYGRSNGQPSLRSLVQDAHPVLDAALTYRSQHGYHGPLVVMGRSLGSAPAIELAARRPSDLAGLILESGFTDTVALLEWLGIEVTKAGSVPPQGIDNGDKMLQVSLPVLLIHAQEDSIVPLWHAQRNFKQTPSSCKRLVIIEGADHNSLLWVGGRRYWDAIAEFLAGIRSL